MKKYKIPILIISLLIVAYFIYIFLKPEKDRFNLTGNLDYALQEGKYYQIELRNTESIPITVSYGVTNDSTYQQNSTNINDAYSNGSVQHTPLAPIALLNRVANTKTISGEFVLISTDEQYVFKNYGERQNNSFSLRQTEMIEEKFRLNKAQIKSFKIIPKPKNFDFSYLDNLRY